MKTWVTTLQVAELLKVNPTAVLNWVAKGLMPQPARRGSPHVWHVSMIRKTFPRPLHGAGAAKVRAHLKQHLEKRRLRDHVAKGMRKFWTDHTITIRQRIRKLEDRLLKLETFLGKGPK
jgi:hypothetical protein